MCGKGRLSGLLLGRGHVGEDAHDVALLHDQELFAIELDLGAGPLAEQHPVADLEVDRDQFADFVGNGLFAVVSRVRVWRRGVPSTHQLDRLSSACPKRKLSGTACMKNVLMVTVRLSLI